MTPNLKRDNVTPLPKKKFRPCSNVLCKDDNPCAFCRNSNNRRNGLKAQRVVARKLKMRPRFATQVNNEESWSGPFRREVKSGKQVKGISAAYLNAERQALVAKAIGDPRPFCLIAVPEGWGSDGLVILRLTTWTREVEPRLGDV